MTYDRARARARPPQRFAAEQQSAYAAIFMGATRHDVRRMGILFVAVCIVSAQHMIKPTV